MLVNKNTTLTQLDSLYRNWYYSNEQENSKLLRKTKSRKAWLDLNNGLPDPYFCGIDNKHRSNGKQPLINRTHLFSCKKCVAVLSEKYPTILKGLRERAYPDFQKKLDDLIESTRKVVSITAKKEESSGNTDPSLLSHLTSTDFQSFEFPSISGVYIITAIINKAETCLYVGKSIDIAQRWRGYHHRNDEINFLISLGIKVEVKILPIPIKDNNVLLEIERTLIDQLQPKLNGCKITEFTSFGGNQLNSRRKHINIMTTVIIDYPDWINSNTEVTIRQDECTKNYFITFSQPAQTTYKYKFLFWRFGKKEEEVVKSWVLTETKRRMLTEGDRNQLYHLYRTQGSSVYEERCEQLTKTSETKEFSTIKRAIEFLVNTPSPWSAGLTTEINTKDINATHLHLTHECPPLNTQEIWTIIYDWLELNIFDFEHSLLT